MTFVSYTYIDPYQERRFYYVLLNKPEPKTKDEFYDIIKHLYDEHYGARDLVILNWKAIEVK